MTRAEIARRRLRNERLVGAPFASAVEVVRWLGAVQAQDYAGAKWAVGQRVRGGTDADVEAACDRGDILRTHVMRPTWHFVVPADIRWMLALTAPQVKARMAYYDRQLALDGPTYARTNAVIARALEGGRHLTREELGKVLAAAGVAASGQRLGHVMFRAELDAVVCSGPRRGKQFTYALLDERVPPVAALAREEALAALVRRYFTSHGPAQLNDFAWWSGLTVADAKAGVQMLAGDLVHADVDGKRYWLAPSKTPPKRGEPGRAPAPQLRRAPGRLQGPWRLGGSGADARAGAQGRRVRQPPGRHRRRGRRRLAAHSGQARHGRRADVAAGAVRGGEGGAGARLRGLQPLPGAAGHAGDAGTSRGRESSKRCQRSIDRSCTRPSTMSPVAPPTRPRNMSHCASQGSP